MCVLVKVRHEGLKVEEVVPGAVEILEEVVKKIHD